MNFEALIITDHQGHQVTTGWNGCFTNMDLARPAQYVAEDNKYVRNDDGSLNLRYTMAFAIFVGANRLDGAPNAAALESATKRIGKWIVIHAIIYLVSGAGMIVEVRTSDTMSIAEFEALTPNSTALYLEAADRYHYYIGLSDERVARVTAQSEFIVLAAIATAIHREKHDGHSWYSDKTHQARTETARACFVAAGKRSEFANYMQAHGHDVWHFLNDRSLNSLASALVGEPRLPAVPIGGIDAFGAIAAVAIDALHYVAPAGYMYNNADVSGQKIVDIFGLSEAAKDRYPVGQIGMSALIKGTEALEIMTTDIGATVMVSNAPSVTAAIARVRRSLQNDARDRSQILAVKEAIGDVIALAVGYVSANPALQESLGSSEALNSFASKRAAHRSKGVTVCQTIRQVRRDPKAAGVLLQGVFQSLADSLSNCGVAHPHGIDAPDEVITRDAVEADIEFKKSETSRKAEVIRAIGGIGGITPASLAAFEDL